MTIDELLGLLDMQEEILQFSHFTNADAWEVGRTVLDVNFRARYNLNIVAVKQGEGVIPIPGPNYVFNEDEHIMVLGHINDIRRVAY